MRKHKNFWDRNAGRYDRFMRKDRAASSLIWYASRPRAGAGRSQRHNPLFTPYNTEKDTGKPRGVQCELPVSFSVFGSETFASSPSPSVEGAGTIMRFFGVRIAVFFFAVGDSQKQKGLCLLARFLKMPPFGNKKAPAFSHENRCVERCSLWAWKVTISPF